jgi:hypothetical protein
LRRLTTRYTCRLGIHHEDRNAQASRPILGASDIGTQSACLIGCMGVTAFSIVETTKSKSDLYDRFWPKAELQVPEFLLF